MIIINGASIMESGACLVVGLNSGTSMDGIDACIVEFTEDPADAVPAPRMQLAGFLTHPYPPGLKEQLLRVALDGTVGEICRYHTLLGRLFAEAVRAVVAKQHLAMESIAVIGSHGQTIHHLPQPELMYGYQVSSTLQIGDPSVIANDCGVTTVGDFRMADVAVGGEGAPLVPYMDALLQQRHYQETGRVGMLLNIGGISNISARVPGGESGEPRFFGFDCGPGNILIDTLARRWYVQEFDSDGKIAFSGKVSTVLLEELMKDEFYHRQPPKSTGRECYGKEYIDKLLVKCDRLQLSQEDIVATVTELTAAAVQVNYAQFIKPHIPGSVGCDLFVSGGGASNPFIMKSLQERFGDVHVGSSGEIGLDPDAKEAIFFALLAYQAYKGRPIDVHGVTGSRKSAIYGKICPVQKTCPV